MCKRRLLSFPLPGVPADCSDEEKMIKLSSMITIESINMVHLLLHLLLLWLFSVLIRLLSSSSFKKSSTPVSSLLLFLMQVRSLGALLRYLEKKRVGVELEDVSMRVPVLALRRFTL